MYIWFSSFPTRPIFFNDQKHSFRNARIIFRSDEDTVQFLYSCPFFLYVHFDLIFLMVCLCFVLWLYCCWCFFVVIVVFTLDGRKKKSYLNKLTNSMNLKHISRRKTREKRRPRTKLTQVKRGKVSHSEDKEKHKEK